MTGDPKLDPAAAALDAALKALDVAIDEHVEGYEMYGEGDAGREGTYTPTEYERLLIEDAIQGLLADEAFVETFNTWQDQVRKARPDIQKQAAWNRGLQAGRVGAMMGHNPYAPWSRRESAPTPAVATVALLGEAIELLADAVEALNPGADLSGVRARVARAAELAEGGT